VQQGGWAWQRAFWRGALTIVGGRGNGATTRGVTCGLPPMVERAAPTYEVGQVGDDDTAVGAAKGGIVRAKALLSIGSNTSAVLRLATSWCCTVPAVSWHHVSTTNNIAAILAVFKSRVWTAASVLLVDALSQCQSAPRCL
jgi:hypothetical protein